MTDKVQPRTKHAPKDGAPRKVGGPETGAQNQSRPANKLSAKSKSKIEKVITLLQRPGRATLAELVAATGWQPHTTRAALTGLKKKGYIITSEKADGVRRYHAGSPK